MGVKLATQLRHGLADLGVVQIEVDGPDEEEVLESLAELILLWRAMVVGGRFSPPPRPDVVPGA